jgi:DNA polymerase/3'-5' exonuclease PolX
MIYQEALEITGGIRRLKPFVKDMEIVAIPKPYEIGLFESGIATVVKQLPKVREELPCKYTQRILPEGIALDLFFADKENCGLIYAMITGSADYSHRVLGNAWVRQLYRSAEGYIRSNVKRIAVPEEKDLFRLIGVNYVEPEKRNY